MAFNLSVEDATRAISTCKVSLGPLVESSCSVVGIHKVSGEARWNQVH